MISRPPWRSFVLLEVLAVLTIATSARAQSASSSPSTPNKLKAPNAHMNVTYYNALGGYVDGWSGAVLWNGEPEGEFHGAVDGQTITWLGTRPQKNSIRLMTSPRGQGGKQLVRAIPPTAVTVVVVIRPLGGATGSSMTPSANARQSANERKKSKPRRYRPPRSIRRQFTPPTSRQQHRRRTQRAQSTIARTRRPRRTEPRATIGKAPSIKNKRRSNKPASIGDGRDRRKRARDERVSGTGNLKGKESGGLTGKPRGSTAAQGGMLARNATANGKGTAAHGMKGGNGPNSAQGVPSGWALIPLINIPASLRDLTNTLLILSDANPGQLASNWMSKITSRTTVYRLRKNIARDARDYASQRIKRHTAQIDEVLRNATERERQMMMNRWQWEIERQYFARVEQGAVAKLSDSGISVVEREQAEKLLKAAKVKPVAGQLPRNHKYAGKEFPRNQLPKEYRLTGVRFTDDGFPDFGPYATQLPNGQMSVQMKLTGSYNRDAARAKIAAGFEDADGIPDHLTWHHHQDGQTMLLVPKTLHGAVRHTGGRGTYKHATGDPTVYP